MQKINFVYMLSTKTSLINVLLALSIFCQFEPSAAQAGINETVQIIDTSEYLPSYYSDYLDYNLMIAASKGYDSEIERLLAKGADIDIETSEGATPLIFAVSNNQANSVKVLLAHNPDLNKRTTAWETPLIISTKNDNLEITEALIRAGADIEITDRFGASPLHYSSIRGNFYLSDLLLYYEADIDRKANDGTTPLMAAIWAGNAEVADLLIQNGANMEARDESGFTPFLIAAQNGDTMMMNLLLREGVDLYEKNNNNYNALDLAIGSNNKSAVGLLLDLGDKWFSSEKEGVNPYYVASAFGRKELFQLLEEKNIPGKPKRRIDELIINGSAKFNFHDFYSGISFSGKEPLLNAGFTAGFDTKFWNTRVLMKTRENLYYQYLDKSSMVYGGIFKDFVIKEKIPGNKLSIFSSLMVAYTFGNQFKGTSITPENKFRFVPSVGLKLQIKHIQVSTGIEYTKSDFYRAGPLWLRFGGSYCFYFSKVRSQWKVIKWY